MRGVAIRIFAAVVSGVLLAVTVPPFRLGVFVWIALVPLVLALWRPAVKRAGVKAFALGWLAGMVAFGIQLRWLGTVSWLGALALPAYLALYTGLFAWFAATLGNPLRQGSPPSEIPGGQPGPTGKIIRRSLGFAFRNAAVWAGLEWLRSWVITGFGWNGLGVAFHDFPLLAQGADVLGVTGLSMLPVFMQLVLVQTARRLSLTGGDGVKRTRLDFLAASGIVLLAAVYGGYRTFSEGTRAGFPLKALLVQLDVPQEAARQLWTSEDIHIGYEEETAAAVQKHPDAQWIIWPEVALTRPLLRAANGAWGVGLENRETLDRVRALGDFTFFTGVNELEAVANEEGLITPERPKMWNSLAVFSPDGELATFRKHHLVIFGETIPFADRFPWLRELYEQQAGISFNGSFSVGRSLEPLAVRAGEKTVGVIPSICFEDTVPRLARKFARGGPQVIVNVTNDGWFKESPAAAQHFANAKFRAIELRRPMLRCANNGVSGALDTTGSVFLGNKPQILTDAAGSHFTRGSLLAEIRVPENPAVTLYALIGDWGVIVLSAAALAYSRFRREPAPGNPV